MSQSTAEHDTDQPGGNPFDDQHTVPRYIAESLTDAMGPHEGIDDIPYESSVTASPVDRDSVVARLVEDVDQHLKSAWQALFLAGRKVVTVEEAAESLRLTSEFLQQLKAHALRRMADGLSFAVAEREVAIKESQRDIAELEASIAKLEAGDEETIKAVCKGGY